METIWWIDMTIRGAPAIGVAGAFGVALAVREKKPSTKAELMTIVQEAKDYLDKARPTAVNLMWATERMVTYASKLDENSCYEEMLIQEANRMADEDVAINKKMAMNGASLIPSNANVIHHCNTGALATVDIGTALGVIYGS